MDETISFKIDIETATELRKRAKAEGKTISNYCRERIAGPPPPPLIRSDLTERIENLEKTVNEITKNITMLTNFSYAFALAQKTPGIYKLTIKDISSLINDSMKAYTKILEREKNKKENTEENEDIYEDRYEEDIDRKAYNSLYGR